MQRTTMAVLASLLVVSIVFMLFIQSPTISAESTTKTCTDLCTNLVQSSETIFGWRGGARAAASAAIDSMKTPKPEEKLLDKAAAAIIRGGADGDGSGDHLSGSSELLMGYDLLANLFAGQSTLRFAPLTRRLTFGHALLWETKAVMKIMSQKGRQRLKELKKLRQLYPKVTKKFVDPNPSKLVEEIGKNVAYKVVKDLTNRGPEFDLDFAVVQMATHRIIASTAKGTLEFETNPERRLWLQEISEEHKQVRAELRQLILEYIRGDREYEHRSKK